MTLESSWYLVWIVGVVSGAWLLPRDWRHWYIVAASGLFLGLSDPFSLLAMAGLTVIIGITTITLGSNLVAILGAVAAAFVALLAYRLIGQNEVIIFGFAFYVLRAIHFLLEAYKGKLTRPSWPELIAWMWFLPTLQVGPIHRFQPFQRDMRRLRWDSDLFAEGLDRILFGYLKVAFVGDYLIGQMMGAGIETLEDGSWAHHYLMTLHYGALLYFKFAGYSDIAIGFSMLLGFRIMENFHFPFLARDISDFWRRWHISLSSWCRDYVYLPVFSLTRTPALAALATMIVLGLWHEISIRYLLWGLWHGVGIAFVQRWQETTLSAWLNEGRRGLLYRPIAIFLTFQFVVLSFVITSTNTPGEAFTRFGILFGLI